MIVHIEPYQASIDAIQAQLNRLGYRNAMEGILKRAINETASVGKKRLYEEMASEYAFKDGAISRKDVIRRGVRSGRLEATIRVKGGTLQVFKSYENEENSGSTAAKAKILRSGTLKELELRSGRKSYKAFVATMKNQSKENGAVTHQSIFQRVPGKKMKNDPNKEAIRVITSLSKAKAAEVVYLRKDIGSELQSEIAFRMLKHMNAVIGGKE